MHLLYQYHIAYFHKKKDIIVFVLKDINLE